MIASILHKKNHNQPVVKLSDPNSVARYTRLRADGHDKSRAYTLPPRNRLTVSPSHTQRDFGPPTG
jgi:hypothetical protein